jgi:hypothetical protein
MTHILRNFHLASQPLVVLFDLETGHRISIRHEARSSLKNILESDELRASFVGLPEVGRRRADDETLPTNRGLAFGPAGG